MPNALDQWLDLALWKWELEETEQEWLWLTQLLTTASKKGKRQ